MIYSLERGNLVPAWDQRDAERYVQSPGFPTEEIVMAERITWACRCGKKLSVDEDLAGSLYRCPKCNDVALVPEKAKSAPKPRTATQNSIEPRCALVERAASALDGFSLIIILVGFVSGLLLLQAATSSSGDSKAALPSSFYVAAIFGDIAATATAYFTFGFMAKLLWLLAGIAREIRPPDTGGG